ncbi:hemocytin, partial [Chelonus insularis]|uniref:hemocytin n=1 Tax=Chelonus insularis TaxID=460826 RepID=UPI00158E1D07
SIISADDYTKKHETIIFKEKKIIHSNNYQSIEENFNHHDIEDDNYNNNKFGFNKQCNGWPSVPINGDIKCYSKSGCIARCKTAYQFPNGESQITISCIKKKWTIIGTEWTTIPHCEPICLPKCQNNGICISPNECKCLENFSGHRCQFEEKPCLNDPPPVQNSQRSCNTKICTIECLNKFVFSDGSSIANLICQNGNWVPTKSNWVSIPDCIPTCTPPCENGGICLALNVCQCPNDFRGPQCQYLAEACSTKNLGFNGGYECNGDENIFSCTLNCPIGVNFTSPPASKYICSYETGIFEPQPIPQCQVTEDFQIIPIENIKNTFYKISNHSWTIEGISLSNANFHETKNGMEGVFNHFSNDKTELKFIHKDTKMTKNSLESKVCFTWGGIHFKTFDGAIYTFDSNCTYTLVQEIQNKIFMITIQNSQGCNNGNNCHRILKIFLQKDEYILHLNDYGYPEFRTSKKILPIPSQLLGMQVKMSAHFVLVSLDFVGLNIKWDGKLFVEVKLSASLWNRTAGLCGRMNGDPNDDIIDRDLTYPKSITTFISSWKVLNIEEICDESIDPTSTCTSKENIETEAKHFCTKLFLDQRFQVCSKSISSMPFYHTCELDFCHCKENDKKKCACETMNIYVRQCFHDQLIQSIDWRFDNLCPMECTGGRIYKSCGPQKQLSCNTQFSELTTDNFYCEEGCYCPNNTVLHKDKCISIDECPCTLRGKLFKPGSSISKNCNTCTCSSGKWICTEVTCRATCAAIGDPHYVTFDKKHFDFMGKCNYYLVKGDNYSIETENIACSGGISESMGLSKLTSMDQPSCTKSVTIRLENHFIKLKQNHQVLIDGEDVTKLPLSVFGAKVRVASSIFIVVNTPNGIEIWWDGISRIYITIPPGFRGKTKGLCGTFNGNQKDDFLTPFGDVEQSIISFANKWKTSEQCNDLSKIEFTHPCDKNPERHVIAEKYCSRIFETSFSDCHWHVDPEQFYQDCKYDMCACESSIDRCLCPNFAAYARECANSGIKIFWRTQFEECQLHCPNGQKYQICGNSCTRSCYDISFFQDCHQECIEGCNCPEGQTLNSQGECILIGQCPCQYNGIEYNAGYREIRPGRKSEELCTCGGGIWTCHPATLEEINEYPKMTDLKTLCSATKNLEATYCEPEEPKTCRNMHEYINQHSPVICRPGCICKKGYVLNPLNGICVEQKMCPCYHGGKSFDEGAIIQEDCNTCTCISGNWKCTEKICRGICSAWGDSHYKTFDDKTYDFQGICNYVLVKGSLGNFENFYVSIQNVPCGSAGVSCSKSVTLCIIDADNKECITLTRGKPISKISYEKIFIRKVGLYIFLDIPTLGLVLQWDQGTRVYIKLDPKWKGRTQGLCGDYNDNNEDDFKTPSGGISEVSARIFGDSWKEDSYCPEPMNTTDTCVLHPERKVWAIEKCGILKSSLFQSCHSEVNIEPYIQQCIFDTCGCDEGGDCECLCTALAAYAYECNEKGIPLKWRSQELCPIQCDENCSIYSPCISACPHQTCDNLLINNQDISLCTQDTCVEGCTLKFCPEGEVYRNSSSNECVPKISCKPFCSNISGIVYYEGDQVSSDACHTCFCSRKKLVCNGVPCQSMKSIELTTVPMEEPIKCIDGWTNWINKNNYQLLQNNKSEKMIFTDVESLPSILDLLNLENSTRCSKEEMIDIECRTVGSHKLSKETGLNVECNMEYGLVCQSNNNILPCEDFEIRVLCQCNNQYLPIISTSPYLTSTTVSSTFITKPLTDNCDIKYPNQPHLTDCHSFYQCISTLTGTKLVEKICGIGTMYNSETQTCDWPYNVIKLRPECGQMKKITEIPNDCQEGEIWNECAIKCNQTCSNYYHILVEQNLCSSDLSCVPGCVNETEYSNCPSHKFWRDSHNCVDIFDCPCITHNNTIIKPGIVVTESECELCQCLSNYYTCDKSLGCENISSTKNVNPTTLSSITTIEHMSTKIESLLSTAYSYIYEENKNKPICNDSMGLDDGFMSEEQITASSSYENLISNLQLSSTKIWQPVLDNPHQYIQFDFLQNRNLTGIMIKGLNDIWTVAYKVFYGNDIYHWNPIVDELGNKKIYFGNFDDVTVRINYFDKPISARFLKIQPVKWHNHIGLKVEILGCFIPYSPIKQIHPIKIVEFKSKCNICHGVFEKSLENIDCKCSNALWWNGEFCVEKQQCPCVVENVLYSVGTSFETNDCRKCLCAMGGIPECHLKICPPCNDGNMQSVVTELCGCSCKPCPIDTLYCSSTNVCIEKSAWCNGVKDCLDDETNCTNEVEEISNNMTKNSTTMVVVTTTEIKNVTKFECEKPICPPGYKPILSESSKIQYTHYSSSNSRIIRDRGTKNIQRITKEPRKKENINYENDLNYNVKCPQFSCKPHHFSSDYDVVNKSSNECPKIQCPSNYQIIYEPTSMYELVPCPKYTCKPLLPKENICNVVGRTFNTFDNLEYKYDICNHILVREMFHNLWYITLEKHCTRQNDSCTKVLAIVIDNDVIVLHSNMNVDINEYTYTQQQLDFLKNRYTSFKICTIGNFIHFTSYTYQFWIIWDENLNVKIGIPETLVHHVDGLCGYYDKLAENDKQKPDGSQALTTKEFGDSWAMDGTPECERQNCPLSTLDKSKIICNTLKDRSFSMCHNVLDIDKYISRCLETTCICLNENKTVDDCRCRALNSFTAECQSRDFTFDLSIWRSIHNCPVYCPSPFIYKDCFRNKCEMTCRNLQEVDPCPIMDVCFSGCFCPDNLIRNDNLCITASECRDCKCNSFGNSNLINFNGKNFTFMGNCTYILSQDTIKHTSNKVDNHTYQILITNIPCSKGICTEALSVLYKGHFLQIEQKSYIKNFISTLDGEPLKIPFKNTWMSLSKADNEDITLLIPAIQLEIITYWHNFAFIISLSSHIFGGAIEGLCGTCNLNNDNDEEFIKSNGELTKNVDEFGASWLAIGMPQVRFSDSEDCSIQPENNCTLPVLNDDPCQILLNVDTFGHCHALIDPQPFLQSCHYTLCEHGNICGDLEYYAQKCREVGVCPKWRTNNLCPFDCPNYLEYQPCGSCPKTCNNLNDIIQTEEYKCNDNNNMEGCFCPENFVLHNSSCIPEKDCFICDDQGHVDGDVWNIDKCTSCYCYNKVVNCERKECQALDAICEPNFTPMAVPGTENECCIKYLCVPIPTNSPPTCVEPQQPECGYGQTMKLIIDNDGCQKFICQCLPLEECPLIIDNISTEVEKENYQEGYTLIVNTTGCCPRSTLVCQPETCPLPPKCPEYHDLKVSQIPNGCCSIYNCEPKQNVCLYTPVIDNINDEKVIVMQINETWKDGPCNVCTCEKSLNKYPTAVCVTTECLNLKNHPDSNDYALKENIITDQCCPQIERFACKDNEKIINVGEEWHSDTNDSCVTIKCENTSYGIEKKLFYQPCRSLCKKGFEYKSSNNGGSRCCGECVATSCAVNDTLKAIGEKWHSDDFCISYECLLDHDNHTQIKESIVQCNRLDPLENEKYIIETVYISGNCCPTYIRKACKANGKIYKPGRSWKNELNDCLIENCVVIDNEKVEIQKTVQNCNTSCEFGWEYQNPEEGQCCGKCKQLFCVYEGILYKPHSIWFSKDNCTRYECQYHNDQFIVSVSLPVCQDVSSCPLENIYNNGCCDICNATISNYQKLCLVEVLEPDSTIGIISEKRGKHGICHNFQAIDGITECHGTCSSSTYFNSSTGIQEINCQCCKPTKMKEININLICEDKQMLPKKIYVPAACSCFECQSL